MEDTQENRKKIAGYFEHCLTEGLEQENQDELNKILAHIDNMNIDALNSLVEDYVDIVDQAIRRRNPDLYSGIPLNDTSVDLEDANQSLKDSYIEGIRAFRDLLPEKHDEITTILTKADQMPDDELSNFYMTLSDEVTSNSDQSLKDVYIEGIRTYRDLLPEKHDEITTILTKADQMSADELLDFNTTLGDEVTSNSNQSLKDSYIEGIRAFRDLLPEKHDEITTILTKADQMPDDELSNFYMTLSDEVTSNSDQSLKDVYIEAISSSVPSAFACPRCGSENLSGNKKGFGLGKAVIGGVLTGGVGLLGGFIGSNKVLVTCMECAHSWEAGKK